MTIPKMCPHGKFLESKNSVSFTLLSGQTTPTFSVASKFILHTSRDWRPKLEGRKTSEIAVY